jgi:hypothetical protein
MRDAQHRKPVHYGPWISYNGGPRSLDSIRVIVVHSTESSSAAGTASWGAGGQRNASWHAVVDGKETFRQVRDGTISWTAPGVNRDGLHVEIVGYAKWSKARWFLNQSTLKRAAWQVARWADEYGIPARWLTDDQLRRGYEGLTTHAQASKVYGGSNHWDPGPGFPKGYFLLLVKRRLKWLKTNQ